MPFDRKLSSTEDIEIFLAVWLRVLYCSFPFFVFPQIFRVCVMSPTPPPLYCFIHLGPRIRKCNTHMQQMWSKIGVEKVLMKHNPQHAKNACFCDPKLVHKLCINHKSGSKLYAYLLAGHEWSYIRSENINCGTRSGWSGLPSVCNWLSFFWCFRWLWQNQLGTRKKWRAQETGVLRKMDLNEYL